MGHRKEDRQARSFLEKLLGDEPEGETASAQVGSPGGRGQCSSRETEANSDPHISYYEGTSKDDGSVSVERVHLNSNTNKESGRKSV